MNTVPGRLFEPDANTPPRPERGLTHAQQMARILSPEFDDIRRQIVELRVRPLGRGAVFREFSPLQTGYGQVHGEEDQGRDAPEGLSFSA